LPGGLSGRASSDNGHPVSHLEIFFFSFMARAPNPASKEK